MPGTAKNLNLTAKDLAQLHAGIRAAIDDALEGRDEGFVCRLIQFSRYDAGHPTQAVAWYSHGCNGAIDWAETIEIEYKGSALWSFWTTVAPHGRNDGNAALGLNATF